MKLSRRVMTLAFALLAGAAAGAEDKGEIRIGQTRPYSGRVSGFRISGRAQEACFRDGQRGRRH